MSLTDSESYAILDNLFGGRVPDEPLPDTGIGLWLVSYKSPGGLRWRLCISGEEAARLSAPLPGTTMTVEWITGTRLDDVLAAEDAYYEAQEQTAEIERYER